MGIAPTIGGRGGVSALEAQANALGVKFEPFPAICLQQTLAPNTQQLFGSAVWVRGGTTLTGVKFRCGVAAAGTLPTTARFGIADSSGKMLAISGNVNALANWAAGANSIPFAATYVPPADGILFPCFVVNGTWGSTQPTMAVIFSAATAAFNADGSYPPLAFSWTGQTDLPVVGASVTMNTASIRSYYLALY